MKKIIITIMILFSSASFSKVNSVGTKPDYKAYILGDKEGNVYYEENSDVLYPLASLTKVMTLIVVFDEIKKGNIGMRDKVLIDWESVSAGGTSIPLKSGEKVVLNDLLKAAAMKSANNAAYALAKHVGRGNISNFIKMMNEKAKSMGLDKELFFYTPAGLPTHMTKKKMDMGTAYGIYRLTIEALKYPEYIDIASQKSSDIKNGEYKIKSTIKLLGQDGIYGLKTGYHTKSMFNITTLSIQNEVDVVTVIFGGKNQKIRDEKVLELNKKFNNSYRKKVVVAENIPIVTIPLKDGYQDRVQLYGENSFSTTINKKSNIRIETDRKKELIAPIEKGTVAGIYKIIIDEEVVFEDRLIVKKDIERKDVMSRIIEIF